MPKLAVALVSVEDVAPVVLVEPLVAPMVLEEVGDVFGMELLGEVLSVAADRDASVEFVALLMEPLVVEVSVEVELGEELALMLVSVELGLEELLALGDVEVVP